MKVLLALLFSLFFIEGAVKVEEAWVRQATEGTNTAAFMKIVNESSQADTLIGASSDIAEVVEVHESYEENGMMGMREIEMAVIEAGATFELKPRGYHVMFISLLQTVMAGDEVTFTLHFKSGNDITVTAPVKEMMMPGHKGHGEHKH